MYKNDAHKNNDMNIRQFDHLSLSISATPAPHPALTGPLDAAFLRHAATTTLCVRSS
jgi:hypothetical protein